MKKEQHSKSEKAKWMSCPKDVNIEYPGLAYIYPLEKITVTEMLDELHQLIDRKAVAYTIFNQFGEKVFLAVKQQYWRKFDLKIFNYYGNEVIQVKQPFKFFTNRILVWSPYDNFLGSIEEVGWSNAYFEVKKSDGTVIYKLIAQDNSNFVYDIMSDNSKIGVIGDLIVCDCEAWEFIAVMDVRSFGVTFPVDIDISYKAMLIGASFLIGSLK